MIDEDEQEYIKYSWFSYDPAAESKAKLEICTSCDKLTSSFKCTECGCFMKIKVNIPSTKCPIGKW
jgi:hypothetical protein